MLYNTAMEIILLLSIGIITFLTRIVNLLNIPIFTDEAIYIRWAQIGLADPAHRYIALTDGKQPLLTWLMYPFLRIFSDPLFAGRFVSVLSSVFSVVGIYILSRELFGKRVALFACIFYILSPFAMILDRLALMDSLLASFGIWSIYFSILVVKRLRLDSALLYGITVGLGTLTKSSAFFFLMLYPLSLLLFDFHSKEKMKRFILWLMYFGLSFVVVQVMYNSLRLSPWFYLIRQKNYTFIYTLDEFLAKPFIVFLPNLNGLVGMLISYITIPVILLIFLTLIFSVFKKERKIIYLFLWFALPFLAFALFGKVLFPRHFLFAIMPLYMIAAYGMSQLYTFIEKRKKILLILLLSIIFYPAYQCGLILLSPADVPIHQIDRNQLFDDWPSGYGVKEVVSYLQEQSQKSPIVVGTEGTFGLFPSALEIYLGNNKNITIAGFWPVSEVPNQLIDTASRVPTYIVFKESQKIPADWPLRLITKYRRGRGNTYLYFYQVMPKSPESI